MGCLGCLRRAVLGIQHLIAQGEVSLDLRTVDDIVLNTWDAVSTETPHSLHIGLSWGWSKATRSAVRKSPTRNLICRRSFRTQT